MRKEQRLAEKCAVAAPAGAPPRATPSHFWTVMSQNGNAPSAVGTDAECLPYCYLTPGHRASPTARPSLIPSLCTQSARAGIEWRR